MAAAVVLIAIVGAVNCLQGTPFAVGWKCDYGLTTDSLIVKVLGGIIFILFLGLLLGPIAAALIQPLREQAKKGRTKDV